MIAIVWLSSSLKNHGAEDEVDAMFEMGAETMDLPLDEKMKFEQGDGGSSFGFVLIFCLPSIVERSLRKKP